MPYEADTSRTNPSCILLLIDQSASMADPFGNGPTRDPKAKGVADAINRLIANLVIKCTKEDGVRDYYHLGAIGYGAGVGPAFQGALRGRVLARLAEVADNPLRLEERKRRENDGAGGILERTVRFPVWVDPVTANGTPMRQALSMAADVLSEWVIAHPTCFPPIVINITDGGVTDGDPSGIASRLCLIESSDGGVLLFNLHLSSGAAVPVFLGAEPTAPDEYARMLFAMSSRLPEHMRQVAIQSGYPVGETARGFALNAGLDAVIDFLDIGTRARDLR